MRRAELVIILPLRDTLSIARIIVGILCMGLDSQLRGLQLKSRRATAPAWCGSQANLCHSEICGDGPAGPVRPPNWCLVDDRGWMGFHEAADRRV